MEEAGLDAVLDGIYRFEYSAEDGYVRFRVVFAAHQRDETKPLKTFADDETYGAEWFTLDEAIALGDLTKGILKKINNIPRVKKLKKEGIKPKGEKIRGREIIHLFRWAQEGTTIFNSRLYQGTDGKEIDNKIVEVKTSYEILIVVKNESDDSYYIQTKSLKYFEDFHREAEFFLHSIQKNSKGKLPELSLKGLCGIFHVSPVTKKSKAQMTICYLSSIKEVPKAGKKLFKSLNDTTGLDAKTSFAVNNVKDDIIAPLGILAFEGSKYKKL